jgi:hypothetical protein
VHSRTIRADTGVSTTSNVVFTLDLFFFHNIAVLKIKR